MPDDPKPAPPAKPIPVIGTGMPATIRLETFGQYIEAAFGWRPFLVGSAARGKRWRDVDVRLILPDDHFAHLFPGYAAAHQNDALWSLICDAISGLAKQMTGLPVDFQIQSHHTAKAKFAGQVKIPLMRISSPAWQPPGEQT